MMLAPRTYKASTLTKITVDEFIPEFKSTILDYINYSMKHLEWARLRQEATDTRRRIPDYTGVAVSTTMSPEELVEAALESADLSVEETLVPEIKPLAMEIGVIEKQPVYYVQGRGIFLWGLNPKRGQSLSVWLTYPAYPKGW